MNEPLTLKFKKGDRVETPDGRATVLKRSWDNNRRLFYRVWLDLPQGVHRLENAHSRAFQHSVLVELSAVDSLGEVVEPRGLTDYWLDRLTTCDRE